MSLINSTFPLLPAIPEQGPAPTAPTHSSTARVILRRAAYAACILGSGLAIYAAAKALGNSSLSSVTILSPLPSTPLPVSTAFVAAAETGPLSELATLPALVEASDDSSLLATAISALSLGAYGTFRAARSFFSSATIQTTGNALVTRQAAQIAASKIIPTGAATILLPPLLKAPVTALAVIGETSLVACAKSALFSARQAARIAASKIIPTGAATILLPPLLKAPVTALAVIGETSLVACAKSALFSARQVARKAASNILTRPTIILEAPVSLEAAQIKQLFFPFPPFSLSSLPTLSKNLTKIADLFKMIKEEAQALAWERFSPALAQSLIRKPLRLS